ncbi:MAG: hypothetical protein IJZ23_09655 [Roseburia sp.]|nr:hypothetical protein [Roseburia sp.]
MVEKDNIIKITEELFALDPLDDSISDEILDANDEKAEELISKYPWLDIYEVWMEYLHTKCPTPEDVIKFANNFFGYYGHEQYIPDPIHFIAYLYYRVDTNVYPDAFTILDSLAITVLQNAGLVDMMTQPNYSAETDSRIQAEIAIIRANKEM